MKFILGSTNSYWWPVTVRKPDPENPGKIMEQRFKALLKPQDQDEYFSEQEHIDQLRTAKARARAERESLARRIESWDADVVDGQGQPVPFTASNLDAALRMSWFRAGIWRALNESALGEEASLGN